MKDTMSSAAIRFEVGKGSEITSMLSTPEFHHVVEAFDAN